MVIASKPLWAAASLTRRRSIIQCRISVARTQIGLYGRRYPDDFLRLAICFALVWLLQFNGDFLHVVRGEPSAVAILLLLLREASV